MSRADVLHAIAALCRKRARAIKRARPVVAARLELAAASREREARLR